MWDLRFATSPVKVFEGHSRFVLFFKFEFRINAHTCANQGVWNVRFLENLTCFVSLKHQFLDLPFCYITDDSLYSYFVSKNIIYFPKLYSEYIHTAKLMVTMLVFIFVKLSFNKNKSLFSVIRAFGKLYSGFESPHLKGPVVRLSSFIVNVFFKNRGIMSLAWCPQDSELLMSCGKVCKIYSRNWISIYKRICFLKNIVWYEILSLIIPTGLDFQACKRL